MEKGSRQAKPNQGRQSQHPEDVRELDPPTQGTKLSNIENPMKKGGTKPRGTPTKWKTPKKDSDRPTNAPYQKERNPVV